MIRRLFLPLAVSACLLLSFSLAQAEGLTGTWTVSGKSWGAAQGDSDHGMVKGDDIVISGDMMTLRIDSQEGSALHGEWCSPNKCEDLVGVVRMDGSLLMADEDTTFFGSMYQGKMELCPVEPGEDYRLAICMVLERK
jgi:hypothetical protein